MSLVRILVIPEKDFGDLGEDACGKDFGQDLADFGQAFDDVDHFGQGLRDFEEGLNDFDVDFVVLARILVMLDRILLIWIWDFGDFGFW